MLYANTVYETLCNNIRMTKVVSEIVTARRDKQLGTF